MTSPAAGWYPDPAGSPRLRYWNGQTWTGHVSPPDPEPEPEASPGPAHGPAPAPASPSEPAPASPPASVPPGAQTPGIVAPPVWHQPTGPGTADRLGPDGQVLAGWWRRAAGYLIDALLIAVVALVLVAGYSALTGGFGPLINADQWSQLLARAEANPGYQPSQAELEGIIGPGLLPLLGWVKVISLALNFLNGVILVAASGQTIGDRMVGTRKVLAGRRVPGFGPALIRWIIPTLLSLLQSLPLVGVAALAGLILDYLWPLWDQRRQALHDKAAHTYVERTALTGPVNR